jgi:hypothetical protein
MPTRTLLAALLLAAAAAGCSTPNVRACSIEEHGEQDSCLEYQRASDEVIALEAKPACARRSGHWADAPCPRANLVAGCMQRVVSPKYGAYTQVTWYYVAATGLRTALEVASTCRAQDGIALSP